MLRFDLTSIAAAISFFVCAILFVKDYLSFIDFCHLLLMLEGIVFLSGALSSSYVDSGPLVELEKRETDSFIRLNRPRYIVGLLFFFAGSFANHFR